MIYRYSVCVCDFYEICCNTWNTRNLGVQGPNIFVQKVIMSPQKCALIPQNRSFNHMYVKFSLSKMIKAFLPKMSQVAYMRCCWPNSPRCQDQEVGDKPIFPMPSFWEHLVQKPLPQQSLCICANFQLFVSKALYLCLIWHVNYLVKA